MTLFIKIKKAINYVRMYFVSCWLQTELITVDVLVLLLFLITAYHLLVIKNLLGKMNRTRTDEYWAMTSLWLV